jgi:hypothetical protein
VTLVQVREKEVDTGEVSLSLRQGGSDLQFIEVARKTKEICDKASSLIAVR